VRKWRAAHGTFVQTMRSAWLILYWSMSQLAVAQATFNVVQHHPETRSYNGANGIFELVDGYLVFSYGWALGGGKGGIQITKYDLNGDSIWQVEHTRERTISPGIIDPIARTETGIYVAGVTEHGGGEPNDIWLYWFNEEGDTIRTRFIKTDTVYGMGFSNHGTRQLIALENGGFLLCGWCAGYTVGTGGCITRLDSTGTILWERNYPQTQYIHNAIELPDGGFVLGGSRNTIQDMAVVIRTDSMGEPVWVRYHGEYAITSGHQALLNDEGNLLVPGNWSPNPEWWVNYDWWSSLYEYSSTGSLLGRKDYYFSYNAQCGFILPKPGGHYWLIGGMNQYVVNPDGVTTLWELDQNLDSLWMRRYWYYEPDGAFSAAYSVRSTSDGGLIMCGATRQGVTDPLPYLQSNWLIKLDEYGCLEPGCHTLGVQDLMLGLNAYLRVWPNPVAVGQVLTIAFEPPPEFTPNGPLRVVVQDALGRVVHETQFQPGSSPLSLGEGLGVRAGLYHLHLTDNTRWLAGAKVVVQ
jgi:hypothetical protein